jgi:hypothetical protein
MRSIEIAGKTFKINELTREDFNKNQLDEYGFSFFGVTEKADEKYTYGQCLDKFAEACLSKADFAKINKLSPRQYRKLCSECIKEVYGAEDEEKNSQSSGGDSPETKQK